MGSLIDLTGHTIGKLYVVERADPTPCGKTRWLCNCACGQEGVLITSNRINEGQKHCGCEYSEKSKKISAACKLRAQHLREQKPIEGAAVVINHFLYKYKVTHEQMRTDQRDEPVQQTQYEEIPTLSQKGMETRL